MKGFCSKNKKPEDDVFDELNTSTLNTYVSTSSKVGSTSVVKCERSKNKKPEHDVLDELNTSTLLVELLTKPSNRRY